MTLLYKEMRLVAHPTSIVFAFLGCLVLVPSYPYSVIFMFGCLAPYITFLNARETNDVWYTAVLPVTKRESVLGKCLLVVFFQLFQLLFSIPFALLRNTMNIANNPVGCSNSYGFSHGSDRSHFLHPRACLDGQLPARAFADTVADFNSRDCLLWRICSISVSNFRKTF